MRRTLTAFLFLCAVMTLAAQQLTSPNGRLTMTLRNNSVVTRYDKQVVLTVQAAPASTRLRIEPGTKPRLIKADYTMQAGKRLQCTNEANEYRLSGGLVMRLYNDGIAFRYEGLQGQDGDTEPTAYSIPEGTPRWMMPWSDGYEGFYPRSTTYKTKAEGRYDRSVLTDDGHIRRWAFPALLQPADNVYVLLTEANIERGQSAASMYNEGELFSVVQDAHNGSALRADHTPWRVAIIGALSDVVESTLVTDVSDPCRLDDTSWIQPGTVSWIYWAYNHGSNDYNIIRKYVDMAVTLRLPYVLIDAEWDEMKDGKTVEDAVAYAKERGIKPMIWYNSTMGWIDGAPGPKYRLNKPEDREREFAWCERIGVAGVKIDFFSGDTQANMDYCIDLLESAARHHLLVNFHGATIPRGWQRTWPNLLSTEGVYGAEWYNNVPTFTERAARHNATLPFTRNVIGPMDYTPCTFSDSQHPHITSHAHELALTVLYESGLQHLADRPESYLAQPKPVQNFLTALPTVWDETRLLDGYPGERVVMARRSGDTWYVAGINGTDEPITLTPRYPETAKSKNGITKVMAFMDSGRSDRPWNITTLTAPPASITCQPRGGFVLVISQEGYRIPVSEDHERMQTGKYEPTWQSLETHQTPEWFRNAKFGIWAHWGPQCVEGSGDWMAREMYMEGNYKYQYHVDHYGHPSEFGFKDILPLFKAERWDPEALVERYKRCGAQYFFVLGNHHDNFDLWDSQYQEWNSQRIGPKRDILAEWAAAAKKAGLPLGISFHADHAWTWYEPSQRYDLEGPKAGIWYDGNLTKEDGRGKWWEGLDPQKLYQQNHPMSKGSWDNGAIHGQWDWSHGACPPSEEFVTNFYDRTLDAINRYNPDLIYFDVTVLPFYPLSDAGMKIAAHMYNKNPRGVVFGKILSEDQKKALTWDVERGAPNAIQPDPWQTCNCIGDWHYNTGTYERGYRTATNLVKQLVDIVSKNGNLLLNIPLRADGTYDEKAAAFLDELEAWMTQNGESIFGTRPWVRFGEGPVADKKIDINAQGFNEGQYNGMDSRDIRFNQTDKFLYVTAMGWPEDGRLLIKSLAKGNKDFRKSISSVQLLGYGKLAARQTAEGLEVTLPAPCNKIAPVLKINK